MLCVNNFQHLYFIPFRHTYKCTSSHILLHHPFLTYIDRKIDFLTKIFAEWLCGFHSNTIAYNKISPHQCFLPSPFKPILSVKWHCFLTKMTLLSLVKIILFFSFIKYVFTIAFGKTMATPLLSTHISTYIHHCFLSNWEIYQDLPMFFSIKIKFVFFALCQISTQLLLVKHGYIITFCTYIYI